MRQLARLRLGAEGTEAMTITDVDLLGQILTRFDGPTATIALGIIQGIVDPGRRGLPAHLTADEKLAEIREVLRVLDLATKQD